MTVRTRSARRSAVGIDLAGSPARTTGYCVLDSDLHGKTEAVHSDEELLGRIRRDNPDLVSIDAPLSLPAGRADIADRSGPHFRECDLELRRRGIRFFPVTLGPMRILTRRGLWLRGALEARGLAVLETYPGAAQDIWGIPRKQHGLERLRAGLSRLGVGPLCAAALTHDELDAITCAIVGLLWLAGSGETIGDPKEGVMLLPRPGMSRRKLRAVLNQVR